MSSEGEKEGGKREARDDLEQETRQEGHHSTTYDGDGLAAVRSFLTI